MKKQSVVILAVVWMLLVVVFLTASITMSMLGVSPSQQMILPGEDNSLRVTSQEFDMIKRYERLDEVRQIMMDEYYQPLDDDALLLGAVRGMMSAANDAYTYYYTPEEMQAENEHSSGAYEGVGLLLSDDPDGYLTVLRVFQDTPAEKSGVKPGDRIVRVNGTDVSAKTKKHMDEAIEMIKSSSDASVVVSVLRGDEMLDMALARETVNVQRTGYRMLDGDIGYIAIYEFMGNDVTGFERALNELQRQGMRALVIDVRNNPGGLLPHVVSIADILLPKGLIVYIEDRYGNREEFTSDENALNLPMAILTNGMSASASEILAGSLQDYGAAIVVGEKTFGKGIVQNVITFPNDAAGMKLTTATYYTPKGRSIHGEGISPDEEVSLPESVDAADAELHPDHDAQLMRAVELLKQKI